MDHEYNQKIEFKEKLIKFFKENKIKVFITTTIVIIIFISFIIFQSFKEKNNSDVSEKFISAGIFLASKDEEKSKNLYEEIILSKNKFYSVLALNVILEKELEENQEKVLNYFKIVENLNISKEQKDLIRFKKALFLIKNSKVKEGNDLLNEIIDTNSKLKELAEEIISNWSKIKNEIYFDLYNFTIFSKLLIW